MEILGERPVWSMSDSEKLSTLDAVVAEEARLATFRLQLIAGLDQSGYAKELGAGDTARLLSQRYRIDATEARRDVRVATGLGRHPATSAALPDPRLPFPNPTTAEPTAPDDADADADDDSGGPATLGDLDAAASESSDAWRVHPAHAEAILSVLGKVPTTVPAENVEFAERRLIELAATHTPSELRRVGRKIRDILDPDGPEPEEQKAYARESLTLKTADRGLTVRGYLANENAELLRTLIHAHAKPHKTVDGELDPRPRDKRQADALVTVLNAAANTHHLPAASSPRRSGTQSDRTAAPASSRCTQEQTPLHAGAGQAAGGPAAALLDNIGPRRAIPSDAAIHNGSDGHEVVGGLASGHGPKAHLSVTIDFDTLKAATATGTGALVFGENLSAAVVRRLACDAEILPIVLGSRSQPLDVGTSQRLVTRPMRRVLNARDKGCVVCGAPPIQCDAHHVVSWLDGGVTAVNNLVLLCKRHHIDLHSGHWQIRIINGVVQVTRPTWTTPLMMRICQWPECRSM
ncbi:HNH endonuclease, partial [Kribbella turkmenica]